MALASDVRPGNSSTSQAVLLVNANSRRGKLWFAEAREALTAGGLDLGVAALTKSKKDMRERVKIAVDAGVPLIICGGGDGTFNSVARIFASSDAVLGVLPLGTGNAFARDLGIQTNVKHACDTILTGKVAQVDMGHVNGTAFLNVASVGLTTLIAENLNPNAKRLLGPAAYFVAICKALAFVHHCRATITTEQDKESFDTMQIVIGNGRFHAGPFAVAPDAGLQTGHLAMYALRTRNKFGFLKLGWAMFFGMRPKIEDIYTVSTAGGTLETTPSRKVVADGETLAHTPIKFGVVPKALKVMAPADWEGEAGVTS